MADRDTKDVVLAANEYAYIQDMTKGDVNLYVGPCKFTISNSERLVEFRDGMFLAMQSENSRAGVHNFVLATSSQYVVLENPPKGDAKWVKSNNTATELLHGKKIVLRGPVTLPLWPGQKASVVDGHTLREDQYLVVRVYDKVDEKTPIGTTLIVRGSEQKFYIPETGFEVVPADKSVYTRSAVTLQDGEYCILLTPEGKRKYSRGPAVVFPGAMEDFVQRNGVRVFRAHHMRKNMGLHVRVVSDFEAKDNDQVPAGKYFAGQELFLHEREGFFFPTENLEVVAEVKAIPVADKEGLYVREIETGKIATICGPLNYLPDPTKAEVVTRSLDAETTKLYNLQPNWDKSKAISIYVPPSSAVLVTAKNKRRVAQGPQTIILDYDEDLEVLRLSTGRPKSEEPLLPTCFLQTGGNKVSDVVSVKTRDHVDLTVTLSYRVSFAAESESEAERWFNVKNYVGLLCDHLGSIIRSAVRSHSIEDFHAGSTDIIRSAILGEKLSDSKRAGRRFEENGMQVYDVEVLEVRILDENVKRLLTDLQRTAINSEATKKQEVLRLAGEKVKEEVNRGIYGAQMESLKSELELELVRRKVSEEKTAAGLELDKLQKVGKARNDAEALSVTSQAKVAQVDAENGAKIRHEQALSEVKVKEGQAAAETFVKEMSALDPRLVAALETLGNNLLAGKMTENLSPLAILGGKSIAEVGANLLRGVKIGLGGNGDMASLFDRRKAGMEKED